METLDSTIVNTALPAMAKSLAESPIKMQSVVIAYSITLAVFIPASGWFADRFGTRKVFMAAISIFSLGSLFCSLSQNLTQITLARVLQGIGGSMLMPIGRLAVLHAFPGEAFLQAISFVTVPALVGPLVGPILGGLFAEYFSWHWIFLINLPIGLIGLIATYYTMPDNRRPPSKFDLGGFFLLAISMVSLTFGLDGLAELQFTAVSATILIVFGLACSAAYWLKAAQQERPLFSPSIFGIPTFRIGLLGNIFSRSGSGGMPFLIPLYLQLGLNYSPLNSGLTMIPVAVAAILAKRFGSPIIRVTGYRKFLIINTLLVGVGIASFTFITPAEPPSIRIAQLFLFGFFNSLQFTAMNSLTLSDLRDDNASSGNTLFSMVQMLALSFSVAFCAVALKTLHEYFKAIQPQNTINTMITAFHGTFICMGAITCCSAAIFFQLASDVKLKKKPEPGLGD